MKTKLYLSLLLTCTPVISMAADNADYLDYNPRRQRNINQRQITNGLQVKAVKDAKLINDTITATVTLQDGTVQTNASIKVQEAPIYSRQGDPNTDGDTFYTWRQNIIASMDNVWVENQYVLSAVGNQPATTTDPFIIAGKSQRTHPRPVFETVMQDPISSTIKCTLAPTDFAYNYILQNTVLGSEIKDLWPMRLFRENGKYHIKTKETVYLRPVIAGLNGFERLVDFTVTCGAEVYKHEIDEENNAFSDGEYKINSRHQIDSNSVVIGEANTLMRAVSVNCAHNNVTRRIFVYQDTGIPIELIETPRVSNGSDLKFGTYNLDGANWYLTGYNGDDHYHVHFNFKPLILDPKEYYESTLLRDLTHNDAIPIGVSYVLLAGAFKAPSANSREALSSDGEEYVLRPEELTLHQIPARTKLSENIRKLRLIGITVSDNFMDHLLSRPNLTDITFENCSITPAKLLEIINKENLTTLSIKGLKSAFTLDMMQALVPLITQENPLNFTPVDNYTMAQRLFELDRLDLLTVVAADLTLEQTHTMLYQQSMNYHSADNKPYAIYCMKRALALAPEENRAEYAHLLNQYYREVGDAEAAYQLALRYKDAADGGINQEGANQARFDYIKSTVMLKNLNNPNYENLTPPFDELITIHSLDVKKKIDVNLMNILRNWLIEKSNDIKYYNDSIFIGDYHFYFESPLCIRQTKVTPEKPTADMWPYILKKGHLLLVNKEIPNYVYEYKKYLFWTYYWKSNGQRLYPELYATLDKDMIALRIALFGNAWKVSSFDGMLSGGVINWSFNHCVKGHEYISSDAEYYSILLNQFSVDDHTYKYGRDSMEPNKPKLVNLVNQGHKAAKELRAYNLWTEYTTKSGCTFASITNPQVNEIYALLRYHNDDEFEHFGPIVLAHLYLLGKGGNPRLYDLEKSARYYFDMDKKLSQYPEITDYHGLYAKNSLMHMLRSALQTLKYQLQQCSTVLARDTNTHWNNGSCFQDTYYPGGTYHTF